MEYNEGVDSYVEEFWCEFSLSRCIVMMLTIDSDESYLQFQESVVLSLVSLVCQTSIRC